MKRAIFVCALLLACKREEDPAQQTTITTTTASAPAATSAGPTQLVALTQPVDSAAAATAPTATLTPTPTTTQTSAQTPSAHVASVVVGSVTASGLTPESVKTVVQKNVARYRACYDTGLRGTPALKGRVMVRMTIDASGAIASAEDAGSDMPDSTVTSCVFGTLGTLTFPQPEAGSATATVPIVFSPPP